MSKGVKTFCIVCAIIFGMGLVITGIGLAFGGTAAFKEGIVWNQGEFITENQLSQTKTFNTDKFDSLDISTEYCDVEFVESDDNDYKVVYTSYKGAGAPRVEVKNNTLFFEENDRHNEEDDMGHIGFFANDSSPRILVYYPKNKTFDKVTIDVSMGSTNIYGLRFSSGNIRTDLGDVEGTDIQAKDLTLEVNYGDIYLQGVFRGKANISNEKGDIEIYVNGKKNSYNYEASAALGDVAVDDIECGDISVKNHANNSFFIENSLGDVELYFN
ncbi:MAG: DUF4097 family beta strand repeat-containing protein [Anaerovoracaceae bacterium]